MKKSWFIIAGLTVVISAIILISCNNQGVSPILQALINSEELWTDQALSNYDFTLERQALAPEE